MGALAGQERRALAGRGGTTRGGILIALLSGEGDPLTEVQRQKQEQSRFARKYIGLWAEHGEITAEQAERLRETVPVGKAPAVSMPPGLPHVWHGWLDCGPPVTVFGGMSTAMDDKRGVLLPGRLAWLTEEGVTDPEQRALYRRLWRLLDSERMRQVQKELKSASSKAKGRKG